VHIYKNSTILKEPYFLRDGTVQSGTHLQMIQMNKIFARQEFWSNLFPQMKRDVLVGVPTTMYERGLLCNNFQNFLHFLVRFFRTTKTHNNCL
jgi:hypothetical protein